MADLYARGWSVPQLAREMGTHGQTIREVLLAEGCDIVTAISRSLTEAQITEAVRLRKQGMTIKLIAHLVGGSESSVRRALKNRQVERGVHLPSVRQQR